MSEKPTVGQKLYSLNVGNAARNREQELTPVIVTKVDWSEKTDYTTDTCLYESPQQWEDYKEATQIKREIYDAFRLGGISSRLTLDDLRKIAEIIGIGKTKAAEDVEV
jgi:hypothetical protein